MSYRVELEDEAEDDLSRLPPLVMARVLDELERLGESPTKLSRPPSFPHPQYQKYQFSVDDAAGVWSITILFQYSQDETTLYVRYIGSVLYEEDW